MKGKAFPLVAQIVPLLLAGLLAAAPARADVWYGSWDPLFGDPFLTSSSPAFSYNLGWGGGQGGTFVNVQVNASCGTLPVGLKQNSGDCGSSSVVQSAKVKLYNSGPSTPPPLLPNFLETLDFNLSSPSPPPTPFLEIDYLLYGPDSRIAGINTTRSDWVTDGGAVTGADFLLQFIINQTDCPFCAPIYLDDFFPSLGLYTGPVLFARLPIEEGDTCNGDTPYVCVGDYKVYRANVLEFRPVVLWTTPEPAGLSLLAGSLIAAGIAGRRRRAVRH